MSNVESRTFRHSTFGIDSSFGLRHLLLSANQFPNDRPLQILPPFLGTKVLDRQPDILWRMRPRVFEQRFVFGSHVFVSLDLTEERIELNSGTLGAVPQQDQRTDCVAVIAAAPFDRGDRQA